MGMRSGSVRMVCGAIVSVAGAVALSMTTRILAQEGVIRGCVSPGGALRIVNPGENCRGNESPLIWNVRGPSGLTGAAGPAGPAGPAGAEGPAGRDGRDAAVAPTPPPSINLLMTVDGLNSNNPTPILSFSLGASNPTTIGSATGGAGAGKANFAALNVAKFLDAMSVPLLKTMTFGQPLSFVKIEVFEVGSATPFATYTFGTAFITSDVLGSTLNKVSEQVTFVYGKLESSIVVNGTTFTSCWNEITNTNCGV